MRTLSWSISTSPGGSLSCTTGTIQA